MDLQLTGRIALITGGAGSIGQAIAAAIRAEGGIAVAADRAAGLAAAQIADGVDLEVTDPVSMRRAVDEVVARHGQLDILITAAGLYQSIPFDDLGAEDWDNVLAVNLKGTFLACQAALPPMRAAGFGRIILLASLAGQVGGVVAGANYAASKAGVLSLVRTLVRQTGHPLITVNAVSPGPVSGGMTANWSDADREKMIARIPVGRFASPQEIADVVAFLASPRAGYIHGARIDINGGVSPA